MHNDCVLENRDAKLRDPTLQVRNSYGPEVLSNKFYAIVYFLSSEFMTVYEPSTIPTILAIG